LDEVLNEVQKIQDIIQGESDSEAEEFENEDKVEGLDRLDKE